MSDIKFKNKFVQTEFGKCLFYCWANLLNDENILNRATVSSNQLGGVPLDTRYIIEAWSDGKLTSGNILCIPVNCKAIKDPNVFKMDSQFDKEYYLPYVAVVRSARPGYLHCIALLQDLTRDNIIILDPISDKGIRVSYAEMLDMYDLFELECIYDLSDGGGLCWTIEQFEHLID